MDKNEVHLYNGELLSFQRNYIMKFTGLWMELEKISLSDVTQTPKINVICIYLYVQSAQ